MYARHQAALDELTQSALANIDLSGLMYQGIRLVANTLAVAYSVIWELLPDRTTLAFKLGVGWREDLAEYTVDVPDLPVVASYPLNSQYPLIVADWPSETRCVQPAVLRTYDIVSSLVVVIPGQEQWFGMLSVDVTASRMFSDEEIHFLQAVANVLALAIARDRLHASFEQRVVERNHEINQRLIAAAQEKAILEERQRLARDLHDSMTQSLYGITLHAQAARRLLAANEIAPAVESLRTLQGAAQDVLDEMRLLIFDLRPPILDQAGLPAALHARLEALEGRANLSTKLTVDGISALPPMIEQVLYRIAQEALNNALKHASARHIDIQLQQRASVVTLDVSDDGNGFDTTVLRGAGGMGLRGIAERVNQLCGQWSIRSTPGAGTQLHVEIRL